MPGGPSLCAIVEPRDHPALEAATLMLSTSGACSNVLLVHGTENEDAARRALSAVEAVPGAAPAALHRLGVSNLTTEAYSDLLYSNEFWDVVQSADSTRSDRVLVFQTDSGVCASGGTPPKPPAAFLRAQEYEICGAPYAHQHGVNGGFSVRSISASQRALREHGDPPAGKDVPEDVFFSYYMGVCPHEVAQAFSCESIHGHEAPFGFHAPWNNDTADMQHLRAVCPNLALIESLNAPTRPPVTTALKTLPLGRGRRG